MTMTKNIYNKYANNEYYGNDDGYCDNDVGDSHNMMIVQQNLVNLHKSRIQYLNFQINFIADSFSDKHLSSYSRLLNLYYNYDIIACQKMINNDLTTLLA